MSLFAIKGRVTPAHLLRRAQQVVGPETVFTTDSGNGTFLAMECLRLERPGRFLAPVDYSCMGYAVPAAVGAKLLSSDDFANAAHDLTGSEALDHHQVAAILSKATGRAIGYTDIPEDAMRQGLLGAGLPADYTEFLIVILGAFKAGFAERVTDGVQRIAGKAPIRFEQYAQDYKAHWA